MLLFVIFRCNNVLLERVTACNDALIQADKVLRKMKDTLANDQQDGTVNQSVEQTS